MSKLDYLLFVSLTEKSKTIFTHPDMVSYSSIDIADLIKVMNYKIFDQNTSSSQFAYADSYLGLFVSVSILCLLTTKQR